MFAFSRYNKILFYIFVQFVCKVYLYIFLLNFIRVLRKKYYEDTYALRRVKYIKNPRNFS